MKPMLAGISLVLVVLTLASFMAGQTQEATSGPGQTSAGPATPLSNPLKVELLKWYPANRVPTSFTVGQQPYGVAFDGANMWTANYISNTVSKLQANDGTVLGTFTVGAAPVGLVFDGANI